MSDKGRDDDYQSMIIAGLEERITELEGERDNDREIIRLLDKQITELASDRRRYRDALEEIKTCKGSYLHGSENLIDYKRQVIRIACTALEEGQDD